MWIPNPHPFLSHLCLLPVLPSPCKSQHAHSTPHTKALAKAPANSCPWLPCGPKCTHTHSTFGPWEGVPKLGLIGQGTYGTWALRRWSREGQWEQWVVMCPWILYPTWRAQSRDDQCTALESQAKAGTSGALCLQGFVTDLTHPSWKPTSKYLFLLWTWWELPATLSKAPLHSRGTSSEKLMTLEGACALHASLHPFCSSVAGAVFPKLPFPCFRKSLPPPLPTRVF